MAAQNVQDSIGEPFKRISVQEAKEMLDSGEANIVDVREPDEWVKGHVPVAKHLPLNQIMTRSKDLPTDKPLLFICQVGQRSAVAAEMAAALGHENLFNVEGGTDAWVEAGFPVKQEQ